MITLTALYYRQLNVMYIFKGIFNLNDREKYRILLSYPMLITVQQFGILWKGQNKENIKYKMKRPHTNWHTNVCNQQ